MTTVQYSVKKYFFAHQECLRAANRKEIFKLSFRYNILAADQRNHPWGSRSCRQNNRVYRYSLCRYISSKHLLWSDSTIKDFSSQFELEGLHATDVKTRASSFVVLERALCQYFLLSIWTTRECKVGQECLRTIQVDPIQWITPTCFRRSSSSSSISQWFAWRQSCTLWDLQCWFNSQPRPSSQRIALIFH